MEASRHSMLARLPIYTGAVFLTSGLAIAPTVAVAQATGTGMLVVGLLLAGATVSATVFAVSAPESFPLISFLRDHLGGGRTVFSAIVGSQSVHIQGSDSLAALLSTSSGQNDIRKVAPSQSATSSTAAERSRWSAFSSIFHTRCNRGGRSAILALVVLPVSSGP